MANELRAWLLDWPHQPLALAACEVVEILASPEIHHVPFGPTWCRSLVVWHSKLLALALPEKTSDENINVVIVAYQTAPLAPLQHAAIATIAQPLQIQVRDGLDCEAPADCVLDAAAIRACFLHDERAVVVPELKFMFGAEIAA
ncbi:MAG: hypothetical protein H7Y02_01260 [Candidatus Obscuribacterales bacterium]|nr:hypothetical protein [Steroidobacteraceae bacterium]